MTSGIPETLRNLAVPVADLKPYGRNPRQGDVGALVESLEANGQYRPIIVRTGTNEVLAGNHTLAAAVQMGWTEIAATYVDVDDDRAKRIVLVDNRSNDLASYDDNLLADLLAELPDLTGTGYDGDALDDLLSDLDRNAEPPTDDVPDPPDDPVTKPGDTIALGDHRLLCGSSVDAADVGRLLDGESPDLLVTDPPYGVSYVGGNHNRTSQERRAAGGMEIVNDGLTPDQTEALFREALALSDLKPGGVFYATVPAGPFLARFMAAAVDALGKDGLRQILNWVKDSLVMGRSDYHYRHEPILYGWAPGAPHFFVEDRSQDSCWEIPRPKASKAHPTTKPVELFTRMVRNSSRHGELVYDPFAGSGTLLLACEAEGRRARAMEIDPRYCDVIVARWEAHTGREAVRHEQTVEAHA